ncbi:tRNA lysidine(34) synthetase TilS [Staphylococcus pettenkoferi]|uniref:tRNA(Ile)-lysidine synthase n=1 Tax=Staphylococcus pettenkoferi TaxID=170573 RepID=A0A9Q4D9I1_9STAP|nr:tRNA lysidine(34) synthetase TilS [uncultured Staphylococcus sp.]MCY1570080.1 tRNA lysidine(34) synthetase TilS [Staphylococcus pettenkoferi]MCY1577274.1 tRNA lysidine(34) synthetase TilS [Staphylococcus pettenkoferi]MCY1595755.1 tRNA lysidine(34) synthetase TilS [Staphylococcus pettenkoferi]MCY1619002.1 tRNA lysidine(34) synthetase TilS [Staphylococcus pettenkoferi]
MKVNETLWDEQEHIVLAVSGGIDSMCLLHTLVHDLSETYQQLSCFHVNHGLRAQSEDEAQLLRDYCTTHDIPLYCTRLNLSATVAAGRSIESQAREARYKWFDQQMRAIAGDVLLTAHHQDDQIETIFYRLFTGRSTRNSLGMAETQRRHSYRLVRPLLETSKAAIQQYQQQHQVPFYEDETNASNAYVRNDIRNRILPEVDNNAQLDPAQLLRLKDWHDAQRQQIQQQARAFIQRQSTTTRRQTYYEVSREAFGELSYNVKVEVLDQLFASIGDHQPLSEKMYQAWFDQIEGTVAQAEVHTTDKWIIRIAYDKFIIMANSSNGEPSSPLTIREAGTYHFNHYEIVVRQELPQDILPLRVRTKKDGDRVALNHHTGTKKVSRIFIDQKVVISERQRMPIVETANEEIIAVGSLYVRKPYQQQLAIQDIGEVVYEE